MNDKNTSVESGFSFDFNNCHNVIKADIKNYNGLSFVDFIVETDTEFLFIEIKNPDNPKSTHNSLQKFFDKFKSPCFPLIMVKKFNDTILSRLAMREVFAKPMRYIFVLEYSKFSGNEKILLYENMHKYMPIGLKNKVFFNTHSVSGFHLYSVKEFNEKYEQLIQVTSCVSKKNEMK